MKRLGIFVVMTFIAFISPACDKLQKLDQTVLNAVKGKVQEATKPSTPTSPTPEPAQNPVAPGVPTLSADTDRDLKEELNAYIECINRSQPRAEDSYNRYLSWVSKASGPNCNERYIMYGLYTLYDDSIEKCNQAARRGKEGAPALPVVEQAAEELAKCNAELIPLVKKASDYYDQQDYKDDACAKGKEMHPQLIGTFERCFASAKTVNDEVDKLKSDLDKRELAKLEGQGLSFQAQTLRFMIGAKELLKTVNTSGTGSVVAKDAYVPKCLEVEKTYQGLDEFAAAHKDEVDKTFWGSAFVSSAKGFVTEAKFLRRELEEGKDPRNRAQSFIENYNRMINDANNLRF